MTEKINLAAKLALLDEPYKPGIVGYLNDYRDRRNRLGRAGPGSRAPQTANSARDGADW